MGKKRWSFQIGIVRTWNVEDRRTDLGVAGELFPETERSSESAEERAELDIDHVLRLINKQYLGISMTASTSHKIHPLVEENRGSS